MSIDPNNLPANFATARNRPSTLRHSPVCQCSFCIKSNENNPGRPLPNPELKRHEAPALGEAAQGEVESVQRTCVRFTGYRVRPLDPDNFAGSVKDLLDALRHALLISGDEPWRIRLETEQVKVAHFAEEKTVIEIVTSDPEN